MNCPMIKLEIKSSNLNDPSVVGLIDELSHDLKMKTGRDGRQSFDAADIDHPRSVFLVAYENGEAVGCGALRPIDAKVCEIKRMYSRKPSRGIGAKILKALEAHAVAFQFEVAWLETGIENQGAVKFYKMHGYKIRENYGKYKGRPECLCFEKILGE